VKNRSRLHYISTLLELEPFTTLEAKRVLLKTLLQTTTELITVLLLQKNQQKYKKHVNSLIIIVIPKDLIFHNALCVHSEQMRGDVVSNGVHCGIVVNSTRHIAAGQTEVIFYSEFIFNF
jgi:hypothetical protein